MSEKNHNKTPVTKQADPFRFWLIRLIWCLGGITLAGLIVGGTLLMNIVKVSGWSALAGPGKQGTEIYSQAQIDKFTTSVLITVQNQPMSQQGARADMAFIASFDAFEQRLTMVALSSDMLLEAEGHGKIRLGEIYALGGPGLLINAINQSLGLDLQNYACTDTHSLAAMVDVLGGIEMKLTRQEAAYLRDALGEGAAGLKAGTFTLSGAQSMAHAMDALSGSKPLGNLQRSLNLVRSAVENMRETATKEAMLPLLSLVFSNIQTNLDLTTLKDIGYEILKAEEIEYQDLTLPCDGSWKEPGEPGGALEADISRNAELVRETLYGARP